MLLKQVQSPLQTDLFLQSAVEIFDWTLHVKNVSCLLWCSSCVGTFACQQCPGWVSNSTPRCQGGETTSAAGYTAFSLCTPMYQLGRRYCCESSWYRELYCLTSHYWQGCPQLSQHPQLKGGLYPCSTPRSQRRPQSRQQRWRSCSP